VATIDPSGAIAMFLMNPPLPIFRAFHPLAEETMGGAYVVSVWRALKLGQKRRNVNRTVKNVVAIEVNELGQMFYNRKER